ncbi:MAG TPA: DUF5063 domain-containing protein [Terracidiphilus sp.]|jgi:hypothetical protein
MVDSDEIDESATRFADTAKQYATAIDNVAEQERSAFLVEIYRLLPKLIDLAISLPDTEPTDEEPPAREIDQQDGWHRLFARLGERMGERDGYAVVFDPVSDTEIVRGSLADDLADIYRDLTGPLNALSMSSANKIWHWRFSFQTHWGNHAVDALKTIHCLLCYY